MWTLYVVFHECKPDILEPRLMTQLKMEISNFVVTVDTRIVIESNRMRSVGVMHDDSIYGLHSLMLLKSC